MSFPASWGLPLWLALAKAGAIPAGQREWHWAALQCGAPAFPGDFPDTRAGAALWHALRAEEDAERGLRPKGRFGDQAWVDWSAIGQEVPSQGALQRKSRIPWSHKFYRVLQAFGHTPMHHFSECGKGQEPTVALNLI